MLLRESLVVKTRAAGFVTIFSRLIRVMVLEVLVREPRMIKSRMHKAEAMRARTVLGMISGLRLRSPVLVSAQKIRHHVLADFDRNLLLLRLSDDRKRSAAVFARGADENGKLPDIHDLLIVIKLQDVESLKARRGRGAVWHHSFHDKAEVFGQPKLRCQEGRHRRRNDAEEGRRLWGRHWRALLMAGTIAAVGAIRAARGAGGAIMAIFSGMLKTLAMLPSRATLGALCRARTLRTITGMLFITRPVAIDETSVRGAMPAMSAAGGLLLR